VGGSFVGFSLIDTSVVKAIFAVSDTSLKNIRLGQRLMVSMEALAHPAAGIITGISPQADPKSRVFSVEVSIANPREEIRPGMIGSISLSPAGESRRRLVVPLSAVIRDPNHSGGFALFCLEEQNGQFQAKARAIGVGSAFGNSIEVTNGVAAGQRIIVLGGELLRDGQRVRILL
jgi:multidrug efflux system membrane fusion protein